jgi:polysaccharide deacetylase family protein (PEP-CTERM system associated)
VSEPTPTAAPPHVFTVDVEDWYQGLALDPAEWPRFAPRLQTGLSRLLALLDEAGVRATFFVVGWQAERTPELVRTMAAHGHEIACHGYSHHFVYQQTPAAFREEVRRSRAVLEAIIGHPVVGFRAPFFSITADSLWALDVLVEEGFRYDSSIFPVWNYRYGIPRAARQPGLVTAPAGGRLFEVPLSTVRLPGDGSLGVNVPVSGGAYFRLYPYRLTQALVKRLERGGERLVFYAHPWEYDPEHPRIRLPRFIPHVTHYMNLDTMAARTRQLLADFRFVPVREAYAAEIAAVRA